METVGGSKEDYLPAKKCDKHAVLHWILYTMLKSLHKKHNSPK